MSDFVKDADAISKADTLPFSDLPSHHFSDSLAYLRGKLSLSIRVENATAEASIVQIEEGKLPYLCARGKQRICVKRREPPES